MDDRFSRAKIIFGDKLKSLEGRHAAVFGIGGVGSFAAEALARSGVGKITVIDCDTVDITNINRQLYALSSTVGRFKTDIAKARILDINPDCEVTALNIFYNEDTAPSIDLSRFDAVIDAIDTVTSKLLLITNAKAAGTFIISSMGAGNKTDPTKLEVTDIYKTSVCPLARIMRHELRKRGVKDLRVVYSTEEPMTLGTPAEPPQNGRRTVPGSSAFVPPAAGLIMAREAVMQMLK